jgi:hypothetical protein
LLFVARGGAFLLQVNMDKGYIKVWRQSTENPLYFSEPFTKWQAWIDLLILSNHKDRYVLVRNISIMVKRGQVLAGENFLADRWQWSRGKVRRYLAFLENTVQQIVRHKDNVTTLITILNYEVYQGNGTANSTAGGQQTVQQTDIPKNVKNVKNKESNTPKVVSFKTMSEKQFIDEVNSFTTYTENTRSDFISYWTERNATGKLMKFQMNNTWETSRRLSTWQRNNYQKSNQPTKISTLKEF